MATEKHSQGRIGEMSNIALNKNGVLDSEEYSADSPQKGVGAGGGSGLGGAGLLGGLAAAGLGSKLLSKGGAKAGSKAAAAAKVSGKAATKNTPKAGGKTAVTAAKTGAKSAAKTAGKSGGKAAATAAKAGATGAAKTVGKGALKVIAKKIPLIGLGFGIAFGAYRAMGGDWKGAGLEVTSGALSCFPGVGTAASLAVDAGLIARDMGAFDGNDNAGDPVANEMMEKLSPVNPADASKVIGKNSRVPQPTPVAAVQPDGAKGKTASLVGVTPAALSPTPARGPSH